MGCKPSHPYENIFTDVIHIDRYKHEYDALRISEADVGKFYENYLSLLQGKADHLSVVDLFLGTKGGQKLATPLMAKIFHAQNIRNQSIDFYNFVVTLWDICSLPDRYLSKYVFKTLDVRKRKVLFDFNAFEFLKEVYGSRFEEMGKPLCGHLHEHTKLTFEISESGFIAYCRKHPAILTPVYDAVHRLRDHILTMDYWKATCAQRLYLYDDLYITSHVIIKYGGDVAVILKDQKIHRVDEIAHGHDGADEDDMWGSAPLVRQKKSIVENLFKNSADILRQQSRDLANLVSIGKNNKKAHKKKKHIPNMHKKGQKFNVHGKSNQVAVTNDEEKNDHSSP